jgi:TRAP-type C4-dicarboxylate transport system permease large subunit
VIQGLTGEPVMRIAVAAFPFFIIMFLLAILITLFPEVVTWLPDAVTLRG